MQSSLVPYFYSCLVPNGVDTGARASLDFQLLVIEQLLYPAPKFTVSAP